MENRTRYAYKKRIAELERENTRLNNDLFQFRMACGEIYDGCISVIEKQQTGINTGWILTKMRKLWRSP